MHPPKAPPEPRTSAPSPGPTGTGPVEVPPRRRRLEPDRRRQEILACAVRLFGEQPYPEVSTADVAQAAGVARGLVNHYFGTKKQLYLEVIRVLVTIPDVVTEALPEGDLAARVDTAVAWFLDVVSRHSRSWLAVVGTVGHGHDPQVDAVLDAADERVADTLLAVTGLAGIQVGRDEVRAVFRAYAGLAKAAAREWLDHGSLTRDQVHLLLSRSLLDLVETVLPQWTRPPALPADCDEDKPDR